MEWLALLVLGSFICVVGAIVFLFVRKVEKAFRKD